jgi:hypothetical protein
MAGPYRTMSAGRNDGEFVRIHRWSIVCGSADTIGSMRSHLLFLGFILAASTLGGCDSTIDCTTQLNHSIQLSVVDAETAEPIEAMVSFLIDGQGPTMAEELSPGRYLIGQEEAGTFHVTVKAEGYETVEDEEYEVTQDECHVKTVEATIELTPTA